MEWPHQKEKRGIATTKTGKVINTQSVHLWKEKKGQNWPLPLWPEWLDGGREHTVLRVNERVRKKYGSSKNRIGDMADSLLTGQRN